MQTVKQHIMHTMKDEEQINKFLPKITGRNVSLIAALFLATSVLSTWGAVLSVDATGAEKIVDVSGLSGNDGFLLLALAIITLVVVSLRALPFWIPLGIGLVALFFSFCDFLSVSETIKELNGELGAGIYLTFIASLGIILGSLMQYLQEKKKKKS